MVMMDCKDGDEFSQLLLARVEDVAWGLVLTNNHLAEVTLCSFPACLRESWLLFLLCL